MSNYSPTESSSIVVLSNIIANGCYKLATRELKLLLYNFSLIRPGDQEVGIKAVVKKDFVAALKPPNKKWGNAHKEITDIAKRLNNKPLKIVEEDKQLEIYWVASVESLPNTGIIEFEFSRKLDKYLLNLEDNFTIFDLQNILQLNSCFSIRLYMILASVRWKGRKHHYPLEQLKCMLGIEGAFERYNNFKKKVIEKAQQELKLHTDIQFAFQEVKQDGGKKVIAIVFFIKQRSKKSNDSVHQTTSPIVSAMLEVGIFKKKAQEIADSGFKIIQDDLSRSMAQSHFTTFNAYVDKQIGNLHKEQGKGKSIPNPAGWLIAAIENYYRNQDDIDKEKEAKKAQEKRLRVKQRQEFTQQQEKLKQAYHIAKDKIVQNLINANPELLEEIFEQEKQKGGYIMETIYDEKQTIQENYNKKIFRGIINGVIQERFPGHFEAVDQKYQPLFEKNSISW